MTDRELLAAMLFSSEESPETASEEWATAPLEARDFFRRKAAHVLALFGFTGMSFEKVTELSQASTTAVLAIRAQRDDATAIAERLLAIIDTAVRDNGDCVGLAGRLAAGDLRLELAGLKSGQDQEERVCAACGERLGLGEMCECELEEDQR